MSYGLKYQCTFDPVGPTAATPIYKLEILQKDYSGLAVNVIGAAVPVLHQWQTDDPKAPIKGSSLNITFVNEGSLPLESFYSIDDDGFKVKHWFGTQLLFEGFLVQDDCSEIMVDYRHEINLSATDNLGLLKDVVLNDSPDTFLDKTTLANIIKLCLNATGLTLDTYVWGRITETSQNVLSSFIDQTLIDPQTFLKDANTYDDCYSVLTKIFTAFRMSLSQSKGVWNIMRWDELRYASNAMTAYVYDSDFTLIDSASMDFYSTAGMNETTKAENGLLKKILRPYQFVKETFNYKAPAQLLRNYDLETLGDLRTTYTTGSGIDLQTIKEYEPKWWVDDIFLASVSPPPPIHFIRVVYDFLENEIERYMVLGNSTTRLDSYKIEATQGDIINLSLSERTTASTTDGIIAVFICLDSGFDHKFLTPAGWVVGQAPYENTFTGDSNNWNSFSTDSFKYPIPTDGLLYIILWPAEDSFGNITTAETQIKDIRLDYNFWINQSTKVIGHTHTTSQVAVIKQNEDIEIFVDSSPRNSIAGTLFLPTITGVLQDRAKLWHHPYLVQSKTLGDLVTWEQLFWRRKPRTILDGTFYGLNSNGNHVSNITVFKYTQLPGLTFVPGTIEIDYRNNKFTGTLWEIWANPEDDGDMTSTYIFKYLYDTK